jgi:hypothetical protein
MPLWEIFHPVAAFAEPHAKAWLAGNITALYVAIGLPAFYVNVFFQPLSGQDQYVGGHPAAPAIGDPAPLERPFVRFKVTHLAIHDGGNLTAEESLCDRLNTVSYLLVSSDCSWRARYTQRKKKVLINFFEQLIEPHVVGYDWEYHVEEPDPAMWRIDGIEPPPHGSEAEKKWAEDGYPSPWQ